MEVLLSCCDRYFLSIGALLNFCHIKRHVSKFKIDLTLKKFSNCFLSCKKWIKKAPGSSFAERQVSCTLIVKLNTAFGIKTVLKEEHCTPAELYEALLSGPS